MKLLLATQNSGKIAEIRQMLAGVSVEIVVPERDLAVEETGESFEENAFLKAKAYSDAHEGILALADDSGLLVDALNGQPGVFSKRYGDTDLERNQKLLAEMEIKESRAARFIAVLCMYGSGVSECFEGKVEGSIAHEMRGEKGFGYDPVFIPDGYEQTFAELGSEVKNHLSHRARALEKVKEWLEEKME